jgi:hypothetical protein
MGTPQAKCDPAERPINVKCATGAGNLPRASLISVSPVISDE